MIDHVDRLPPAEMLAVLKLVERWAAFPRFAFVIAFDRAHVVHALAAVEGDATTLERALAVELEIPPVDTVGLTAWVRHALDDLATELGVAPPDVPLDSLATLRQAKRFLNAVTAAVPLAGNNLCTVCLRELA